MSHEAPQPVDGHFDEELADRAVTFMERYVVPSTTGKPLRLLGWQKDFVRKLYGTRDAQNRRVYKRAILSTGKKQGKNLLTSAICLYELLGGQTPSPFVVSASTTRENAGQIYREIAHSVRNNKKLSSLCKCLDSTKDIRCARRNARYKAFSADAGAAEGENISCCVIDELHAHSDNGRLFRSLEYSTVARPDGLVVILSTAGHDQSSLWFDLFQYALAVQRGDTQDPALLAAVYTTDPTDDIDDPATWRKANPSLGVSFGEDDFRLDLQRAKQSTADLLSFKRYRLNQWVQAEDAYIDPLKWDRCHSPMTDDQLRPYPLFVAADLSQTTDPCSVSCCWALPERRFYVRNHSWVCEEGVRRREESNLPKYRQYEAEGVLTITRGTANDYRQIRSYITDLRERFPHLKSVTFDAYNALEMAAELMGDGLAVERMPQNHRYFTAPTKEFEIAVNEQRILHDGNRMLRWALQNTRLDVDAYGNVKPDRGKSTEKIDMTVATLMAYARAVTASVTTQPRRSVYDDRPPLVF